MTWTYWQEQFPFQDLLGVIPPGAECAAHLIPGKMPGFFDGTRWYGRSGAGALTTRDTTQDEIAHWIEHDAGIGILGRTYPAFDNDCSDPDLSDVLHEAVCARLPSNAPVRRRSNSPRTLIQVHSPALASWSITYTTPDGADHLFEFLATGRYYNVEGMHPSGATYEWFPNHEHCVPPAVPKETVDNIRVAVLALLIQHGCIIRKGAKTTEDHTLGTPIPIGARSLMAPSHADIRTCLAAFPDTPENIPDYDTFVDFVRAIKASCGGDEDFYSDFEDWAHEHPIKDGDPDRFLRDRWASMTDSRIGYAWLQQKCGLAHLDFDDAYEEVPPMPEDEPSLYDAVNLAAIFADHTEPEDFVEGTLCRGDRSILAGDSNTGKSHVALDIALHVATGRTYLGREVEAGPVLYLAGEGQLGMRLRAQANVLHHKLDPASVPFEMIGTTGNFRDVNSVNKMLAAVGASRSRMGPLALVIIDTLACALVGGNDNDAPDIGLMLAGMQAIVRKSGGAHVMALHHTPKANKSVARGHGSLRGAIDTELMLTRADQDAPIRLETSKQRILQYWKKPEWLQIKDVPLNRKNRRGKDMFGPVLVPAQPPAAAVKVGRYAADLADALKSGTTDVTSLKAILIPRWKAEGSANPYDRFTKAQQELSKKQLITKEGDTLTLIRDAFDDTPYNHEVEDND